MAEQRKWAIAYMVVFLIMIFLNYWTGTNVGGVADDNEAIIQPAGFAFSIWGLIYALVFIWIIKVFFSKTWEGSMAYRVRFWPIVNFLLNGIWIFVFTQEWTIVSIIVIAGILYTLAEIYSSISEGRYDWFDRLPFSIYFGWVTVATIVNIFTAAVDYNIETILGMGEFTWTIIVLIVATLIGLAIAFYFRDWLYPLVIIWPFAGIFIERNNQDMVLDVTLIASSAVLLVASIIVMVRKLRN